MDKPVPFARPLRNNLETWRLWLRICQIPTKNY